MIIGCGYTGACLARRLALAGARLTVTRRSLERAEQERAAVTRVVPDAQVTARRVHMSDPGSLESFLEAGSIVVVTAPPGSDPDAVRSVVRCAAAAAVHRLVYVSSTGVYPASGGAWVDESVEPAPMSAHGVARLAAESSLQHEAAAVGLQVVLLRAAGIYGPGRGVAARLRVGTYRVVGGGQTFASRIHVEDLCTSIIAAALAMPLPGVIYNVADKEPTTSRENADAIAAALGCPRAPSVDPAEVSPAVRAMLGANRRIDATRLRDELGVVLRYPSVRDALATGDV